MRKVIQVTAILIGLLLTIPKIYFEVAVILNNQGKEDFALLSFMLGGGILLTLAALSFLGIACICELISEDSYIKIVRFVTRQ